jgi:phage terminase large subunit
LQTSIKDSVHKLLCDRITALGLLPYFYITRDSIKCNNGSEFIFKGIQNNVMEIKSMEGISICWVEEAQAVNEESWEILIPTIRKEGSEIWVSFNPDRDEDATYQRFVINPPRDCKSVLINYTDNPWFPEVLRREMEYCKEVDYGKYEHVWLGKTVINTEAQVYHDKFEMKDFETPPDSIFYFGADWGFACLVGNTVVPTDKGNKFIKDIKVGDRVLTRDGYKKVLFTKNKGKKTVYDIDFGYKTSIIATEDHKIFTSDGWKCVKDLSESEEICVIKLNLMAKLIKGIQTVNTRIITIIDGKIKERDSKKSCIGKYGRKLMEIFQKGMTYTTLTGILSIMKSKILCVLRKVNIRRFTIKINLEVCQKKLPAETDIQKKTGLKEERSLWKLLKKGVVFVKNVVKNLLLRMFTKNIVVQSVESTQTQEKVIKNMFVRFVEKFLLLHLTPSERPVLMNVHINLVERKEQENVYDITVEGGEFFANGILVHNCDPTAITRCFIQDQCLYIDYEAGGVGVEFEELPALFESIPDVHKWQIRADCARPETISYVKRQGFNIIDCPKWKGSVEDGVEYIRSFRRIYVHPRCPNTYNEFKFYSYKQDRNTGQILPIILDKDNHYLDSLRYGLNPYIQKNVSILDVL